MSKTVEELYIPIPNQQGKDQKFHPTFFLSFVTKKITFISAVSYKSQAELHLIRTLPRVKWTRIRNPIQKSKKTTHLPAQAGKELSRNTTAKLIL